MSQESAQPLQLARSELCLLLLLAFGSGCASLIYEIVWFQSLQLTVGSTAVSMGILLAAFMGGLCLGSAAMPRLVSAGRSPLRVFALLEFGIALLGLAVLFFLPGLGRFYSHYAGHGLQGFLLRGILCLACVLPATIFMGATFPCLARCLETSPVGVSWLGFLYAANTMGAVFGCLAAGFYLLRIYDVGVGTYVAAAMNLAVALASSLINRASGPSGATKLHFATDSNEGLQAGAWRVLLIAAVSGFCSLGAEVVWTRLLSLVFGATVYTFSIILAVVLAGLALGSAGGALLGRSMRPQHALALCQMLAVAAIDWSAWMVLRSLPYWPVDPSLARSQWFTFQLDVVRCAWAILPPALLWGASFPLALAAAAKPGQDPGILAGRVYAVNTVGAILGALGCSILLIPWVGTQNIQRILMTLSALGGLMVILPWPARNGMNSARGSLRLKSADRAGPIAFAATLLAVTVLLVLSVPPVSWELVAYGRYLPTKSVLGSRLYMAEGMNASVAVTELKDGVRNFHVSGKVEASSDKHDMRLQRMLGHLPALLHHQPRSILVVGCGAGVTAGSFLAHPSVEKIVICELEPLIPKVVAQFFGEENYDVLQDPRVQVIYDDSRNYILTTQDSFDIITSDPIHPWVKGAANLYTKEYFELCKKHLNAAGLVTHWVPLYESNQAAVKSELATFGTVFPNGTIWSNDNEGSGYDLVLLGGEGAGQLDLDRVQQRLTRADYRPVLQSLRDVGLRSGFSLLATYAGQNADLKSWLERAQINTDRNLRLQYLAGMGLNSYEQDQIYSDLLSYRRFPADLFVGSELQKQALRELIERPRPKKRIP